MKLTLNKYEPLIKAGLVKAREERGLVVLKYANKVFWDNLWSQDELLLEARGHIFDANTGECVVRPFHKLFNWDERPTGLSPFDSVIGVKKVNGFMGAVTFHKKHGMIFSTTGSVSSDFAKLAENHWKAAGLLLESGEGATHLFEVVDESDPHIIPEEVGLHYLSSRGVSRGDYDLSMGLVASCKNPDEIAGDLAGVTQKGLECNSGGYVIYKGLTPITKVKSRKYLFQKALARMREGRLVQFFNEGVDYSNKIFQDDFSREINILRTLYSPTSWGKLTEQQRLEELRRIIYVEEVI
jgi:hypothetical protein